jgi:hypothetical protein
MIRLSAEYPLTLPAAKLPDITLKFRDIATLLTLTHLLTPWPYSANKIFINFFSRGPLSLVSTTEELLDRKVAAPVYKTENMAVGITILKCH